MALCKRIGSFLYCSLPKDRAEKHRESLTELVSQIPNIRCEELDILAEENDERKYLGKWDHSIVVYNSFHPIGVILAYERMADKKEHDTDVQVRNPNSIYLQQVAVAPKLQRQGIGTLMLKEFLDYNGQEFNRRSWEKFPGYYHMEGDLVFTLQTNAAETNKHVRQWYEDKFGFKPIGEKHYSDRADLIMMLRP